MTGKHSRTKGASFEREIARLLKEHTGRDFRRNPQGAGAARQGPDIQPVERMEVPQGMNQIVLMWLANATWLELKRRGTQLPTAEIEKAIEQDRESAEDRGLMPVAIWKRDRGKIVVAFCLEDLL